MPEVVCIAKVENELGEGVIWNVEEKALYWVDAFGKLIQRYRPLDGAVDRWPVPEEIGSLVFRKKGGIVAGMRSGFRALDLDRGTDELLVDPQPGDDILLNDGKCDRMGRYWCGTIVMTLDRPDGILWRLDPDLSCHAMDHGIMVSNGIAWSPDDKVMYFADTRAEKVYAYDFDLAAGTIASRRVFLDTTELLGRVDGATVDAEGFYWCAMVHGGAIHRYAPDGRLDRVIELPVKHPTMCTFGGDDLGTLYVVTAARFLSAEERASTPEAGALFAIHDVGAKGLPEPLFAG